MKLRTAVAVVGILAVGACGSNDGVVTPTTTSTNGQAGQASSAADTPAYLVGATPAGVAPTQCPAIGFDEVGAAGAIVTTYTRCGFTVTAMTTNWTAWTGYGKPAPFIGFMSAGGVTATGKVRVTSAAGTFTFRSVDIYSSTTKIPYLITGQLKSATVFTLEATQPNTFGKFATVTNPNPETPIDTLVITLTNPAAPCCANPVGLDNLAVK